MGMYIVVCHILGILWVPHCNFRSVVFHYIACNFRFVKATRTATPTIVPLGAPLSPTLLVVMALTSVQTNEPSNVRSERH